MNELINRSAELTMSSRDIAEDVTARLLSGDADREQAHSTALEVIGYASDLAGNFDFSKVLDMSAQDADAAYQRISSGRDYLINVSPLFDKYPVAQAAIKNIIQIMYFSESALAPYFSGANGSAAAEKTAMVKTYIIRNPKTSLLKIGRSIDVEGRVKALETGSGTTLEVLAVIDGNRERELHQRFSKNRRHGEWFEDVDGEISNFAGFYRCDK